MIKTGSSIILSQMFLFKASGSSTKCSNSAYHDCRGLLCCPCCFKRFFFNLQ
ncbi:hypothetical protein X975_17928, partial [Stegodyphus mimosarum]